MLVFIEFYHLIECIRTSNILPVCLNWQVLPTARMKPHWIALALSRKLEEEALENVANNTTSVSIEEKEILNTI